MVVSDTSKGPTARHSRSASRGLDEAPRSGARHKLILSREQCLHERARESSIINSDVPLLLLLCPSVHHPSDIFLRVASPSMHVQPDVMPTPQLSRGRTWSFWTGALPLAITD